MGSNKKVAITSAVLILLIIITAASIIAIFAAAQQTVNSEVSVTYKSEYVSGTASAKYYVGEADIEGTAMRVNGEASGATSIEFNSRNANQNATLSPVEKEIKLSETDNFVVFEYYFTNTNSQNDFMAILTTSDSNVKNMTITTATSDEKIEDFSTIKTSGYDISTLSLSKTISASSNGYVYVKVKISNLDNDADFKLNFNWYLGKAEPNLEKLHFELVDGDHYVVSDEGASGVVVIPEEYGGYPVTCVGSFYHNENIISVTIPDSVTGGIGPFSGSSIQSISIGSGKLDEDAKQSFQYQTFYNCKNLNEVILSNETIYKYGCDTSGISTMWLFDTYGYLFSYLKSGTGKVKIWTEIDDGTNKHFNGTDHEYGTFTKSPTTETINGRTYNVYTKN